MNEVYCPNCEEQGCYKDGVCSKCNFTTQDPNNLRCCFCGGEVEVWGTTTDCYHESEGDIPPPDVPRYLPECMAYGCLPEAKGIDDIPKETKEETIIAYMELCKRDE